MPEERTPPAISIPELLRPSDYEYYKAVPLPYGMLPRRDTPEALRKSLDKAHDNLRATVRENDRLRLALLTMHRRQKWGLRIFIALQALSWSALGGVIKWLIPYAVQGMAK